MFEAATEENKEVRKFFDNDMEVLRVAETEDKSSSDTNTTPGASPVTKQTSGSVDFMKFYKEVLNRGSLTKLEEPTLKEPETTLPAAVELQKSEDKKEEEEYPQYLILEENTAAAETTQKQNEQNEDEESPHTLPRRRTGVSNLLSYCPE